MSDFEKKFSASACRKKKIAYSTNVIESLWEKKGKKYPAHQIARKRKFLMTRNNPPHPSRVKWSALNTFRSYAPVNVNLVGGGWGSAGKGQGFDA